MPDLVKDMYDTGTAVAEDPIGEDANDLRESLVEGKAADAMMNTQSNMKFLSQFSLSQSSMNDGQGLSPGKTSDHYNEDLQ